MMIRRLCKRNLSALLVIILICMECSALDSNIIDEESSSLKCDACQIISQRFAKSFAEAEKESNKKLLNEDEYIESADSTCDEDWSGYGVQLKDNVPRLVGPDSDVNPDTTVKAEDVWDRRLQDFCDELLAESPDEKTLYNAYSSDPSSGLETYLCKGEKIFGACSRSDFGPWPGDDYEDYDDTDFDFVHDEF